VGGKDRVSHTDRALSERVMYMLLLDSIVYNIRNKGGQESQDRLRSLGRCFLLVFGLKVGCFMRFLKVGCTRRPQRSGTSPSALRCRECVGNPATWVHCVALSRAPLQPLLTGEFSQ
jgi:hypothetical protein